MPTIREEIARGADALRVAGVADERLTASLLLARALGVDRTHLLAYPERALTDEQLAAYDRILTRRAAREPFQQITGVQEFYGLDFEVTPDVLIPRPETELIVETGERLWRGAGRVLDIGTGSGCLAVTLAKRLPSATVTATDLSGPALAVARRNARRHGATVDFVRADLASALSGPFDLVVSNPPYVPDGGRDTLQPEVRDHEPHLALFGGMDGLDVYRRLFADVPRLLAQNGLLIVEM